jgi:hypothetical protein
VAIAASNTGRSTTTRTPVPLRTARDRPGAVQIGLLIAALIDIHRRPAGEIRGSKWAWTAISLIDLAGPISYFAFGRRRER